MKNAPRRSSTLFAAIVCLGMLQATEAAASTFEVSPIKLTLPDPSASGLVSVHNASPEAIRLQVNAWTWDQNRIGELKLTETQDVVFFPAMVSLKPGETRNIRVGMTSSAGAVEKTYRIFVEELPNAAVATNGIRVLTRFGIPVFVPAIAKPEAAPKLKGLSLLNQTFTFALDNVGNTHFLTKKVRVRAESADKGILLEEELPAWYVLAGEGRDYSFKLPASACGAERLVVLVDSDARSVESTLPVSPSTCQP